MDRLHPDTVAYYRSLGAGVGREQERARHARIDALMLPGYEQLAAKAKRDGITPEQFAVLQTEQQLKWVPPRLTTLRIPVSPPVPLEPDPAIVAAEARRYIREQAAQGLSITLADAVGHVRQTLGLPSRMRLTP